jgi:hypothetical protein
VPGLLGALVDKSLVQFGDAGAGLGGTGWRVPNPRKVNMRTSSSAHGKLSFTPASLPLACGPRRNGTLGLSLTRRFKDRRRERYGLHRRLIVSPSGHALSTGSVHASLGFLRRESPGQLTASVCSAAAEPWKSLFPG